MPRVILTPSSISMLGRRPSGSTSTGLSTGIDLVHQRWVRPSREASSSLMSRRRLGGARRSGSHVRFAVVSVVPFSIEPMSMPDIKEQCDIVQMMAEQCDIVQMMARLAKVDYDHENE